MTEAVDAVVALTIKFFTAVLVLTSALLVLIGLVLLAQLVIWGSNRIVHDAVFIAFCLLQALPIGFGARHALLLQEELRLASAASLLACLYAVPLTFVAFAQ